MAEKTRESCIICQIVGNRVPSYKIYEDELSLAVLDVNGANPGHCFLMPKNHYPIIEQVPNDELAHLFVIANKISSAIFGGLKAQGTNIFIANGVPAGQTIAHFMINIIPRGERDNINLQWSPKQLTEEEMSTVELKLKENTENVGIEKTVRIDRQKTSQERSAKAQATNINDNEENYFMKQLRRIP